jgi:TonB-linked SusC/RagA family outer membrane protein
MGKIQCSYGVRAVLAAAAVMLLSGTQLAAQTGTVTGRVINAETAQPVSAAQVFIEGTSAGVLSRQNGSYLLVNVPPGTQTVSVQRIGFRDATAQVTVGAGATVNLDFQVYEEALQLDAVVVTGTVGQTQRRAVANAITQLDASEVTNRVPIANMQEMLSGRTPGLTYNRSGGVVGGGAPVNIRGFSSIILGNQPLIYVDGVRVDNTYNLGPDAQYAGYQDFAGSAGSALDDIDPNSIESIEVIKGPAAATLYGSEASAGVIQIITKKGITGAPEFDVTVRQGQNFWLDPAGVIGEQWGCPSSYNAAPPFHTSSRSPCGDNPWTPGVNEDESFAFNIIDYHKDKYGRDLVTSGYTSGYNLGVRGGTDQVRYFVSGDWADDTGIVDYNFAERLSLRTNVDVLFTENLTISFNAGFTDGLTSYAQQHRGQGGFWTELAYAQGDHLDDPTLNPSGPGAPFGQPAGSPTTDGFYERDPAWFEDVDATRDWQRLTTSLTAQHTVGDWLTQRVIFGLDRDWGINDYVVPRSTIATNFPFPNTSDGDLENDQDFNDRISFSYNASASYQLNDMFTFTTSAGVDYNSNVRERWSEGGDGLPLNSLRTVSSVTNYDDPDYSYSEAKSLGYFIQEGVAINDRIYLTGAVRFDDNSVFGSSTDLLVYPKAQASWVVSEEPFWSFGFFDEVRLRSAYGKSGRAPGALAGTAFFSDFVGPGGTSTLIYAAPGNPNVEAEKSEELEAGVDFALLDQRISGEFTWFHQWVRDAIVNEQLAPSEAFTGSVQANLGEINNWGWEAALDFRVYQSPAFSFDLRLSGDHSDNILLEVTEEQQNENFVAGYYYPNVASIVLDSVSMYDCGGPCSTATDPITVVDPYDNTIGWQGWCDLGDPDPSLRRKFSTSPDAGLYPGGASVPCDSAIDAEQTLFIGRGFAPYSWTIAPTMRFLNNTLEVTALAQGQYGRWYADLDAAGRASDGLIGALQGNARVANTRDDPMWQVGQVVNDDHYQGRFDASFWRLREISVRYQLPRSILETVGVDRASLGLSARNLWYLWRRQDHDRGGSYLVDPENVGALSQAPNVQLQQVPGTQSWAVTLRVAF